MKFIKILLILIGLAALLVGGFCAFQAATGRMDVAATGEHVSLSSRILQGTREAAVQRGARQVDDKQLPDLNDPDTLLEAVAGFEDMCAACHTPPGGSPTAVARGLNPQATDLAWAGANRAPAELFWTTKHGIRMTGMPAWGPTHADEELWPVVALITRFPSFEEEDYGNLLQAAREAGVEHHHHNGEDHGGGHDHDHGHDSDQDQKHGHDHHAPEQDQAHDGDHHQHHSEDDEEEHEHAHAHDH
jgi:hypothetical protein